MPTNLSAPRLTALVLGAVGLCAACSSTKARNAPPPILGVRFESVAPGADAPNGRVILHGVDGTALGAWNTNEPPLEVRVAARLRRSTLIRAT